MAVQVTPVKNWRGMPIATRWWKSPLTRKRRESVPRWPSASLPWMSAVVVAVAVTGLVGLSSAVAEPVDPANSVRRARTAAEGDDPAAVLPPAPGSPSQDRPIGVANEGIELQAVQSTDAAPAERLQFSTQTNREEVQEYDPWEPYNEKMFAFNHDVFDRFLLKPAATVWDKVVPDWLQQSLANAFDNLGMPRRLVNSLLQAKFRGAAREVTRFFINTTFGIAGFFDIAKDSGLQKSDEDTGQTLGFYGVGPGPYLILPILSPLTVRDGIGYAADIALDPLNYFIPFAASMGRRAGETVNDRSGNLELFQSVEENTVDLYSAVRNAYLQRRQRAIEE